MTAQTVLIARSVEEAVSLVGDGFMPLAGGTDLIPRLPHGLCAPSKVVAIGRVDELCHIDRAADELTIGACVTLGELSRSPACPPWLQNACSEVAAPRVRELATVGGAVLQSRRCRFLNRPAHWRASSGTCLQTGGTRCLAGGDRCHAQQRSLLSTVLMAVGASVAVHNDGSQITKALDALYPPLGAPADWHPPGLVTRITIPHDDTGEFTVVVHALRRRHSIDYHDLVVACAGRPTDQRFTIAIGAARPYPYRVEVGAGDPADAIDAVAGDGIAPVQTGRHGTEYLRRAAGTLVRRALEEIRN